MEWEETQDKPSGKTVERPLEWKTSGQRREKEGVGNDSGTCSSPREGGSGSILSLPASVVIVDLIKLHIH